MEIEEFRDTNFRIQESFTGSDIRIARVTLGLSQEDLADYWGCAVRTIERLEHYLHCPTRPKQRRVLEFLESAQRLIRENKVPPTIYEDILWTPPTGTTVAKKTCPLKPI